MKIERGHIHQVTIRHSVQNCENGS